MFRLLPWSPAIGGNKVMAEDLKMLVAREQHKPPGRDSPTRHRLKRKRDEPNEPAATLGGQPASKPRLDDYNKVPSSETDCHVLLSSGGLSPKELVEPPMVVIPTQVLRHRSHEDGNAAPLPQNLQVNGQATAPPKMDVNKLRQTLEAQLNLEVLLKHNELRLIDQEIAKCQIALEQLRRCTEIPYPGFGGTGISQSVSGGTGMAVPPSGNSRLPASPAPWGVTDGPYTRHYAKWLLPDPYFDGREVDSGAVSYFATHGFMDGRATRGSVSENNYPAGPSRSQRGAVNAKLQALSSGYPPAKDKAGPMIIKRKSDGQIVKLVCLDCRRDNFSSTQGFINHCRIAHNRNFASHDAAAAASGEPVEVDQGGMIIGNSKEPSTHIGASYVHPLIRSAHVVESTSKFKMQRRPSHTESIANRAGKTQSPRVTETSLNSHQMKLRITTPTKPPTLFKASSDTPHLSSLMEQRGIGLDLQGIVGDAKTTVDFDAYSSERESDDDITDGNVETGQDHPQFSVRGGRQPARTTMSQAEPQRSNARKGEKNKPHQLRDSTPAGSAIYTSPYIHSASAANSRLNRSRDIEMTGDSSENLSPQTVESNQAPSLVSDDDEYEAPSESESPIQSSSEVGTDQDFDHVEVEDDEGAATSTTTTDTKTDPELRSPPKQRARPLSKSLRRRSGRNKSRGVTSSLTPLCRGKGERRVSFVSSKVPSTRAKDVGRRHRS